LETIRETNYREMGMQALVLVDLVNRPLSQFLLQLIFIELQLPPGVAYLIQLKPLTFLTLGPMEWEGI
jgi:hypothetical protein